MNVSLARTVAGAVIFAVAFALVGCAPNVEDRVRDSLASDVEDTQDYVWPYRHKLVIDAEATIPDMDAIGDLRPMSEDQIYEEPRTTYQLLAVEQGDGEASIRLIAHGRASINSSPWTTSYKYGYTCFTLTVALNMPMVTSPAECVTADGHHYSELPFSHRDPSTDSDLFIVRLDDLDVRLSVDSSTYKKVCQCTSGSVCHCPGG